MQNKTFAKHLQNVLFHFTYVHCLPSSRVQSCQKVLTFPVLAVLNVVLRQHF